MSQIQKTNQKKKRKKKIIQKRWFSQATVFFISLHGHLTETKKKLIPFYWILSIKWHSFLAESKIFAKRIPFLWKVYQHTTFLRKMHKFATENIQNNCKNHYIWIRILHPFFIANKHVFKNWCKAVFCRFWDESIKKHNKIRSQSNKKWTQIQQRLFQKKSTEIKFKSSSFCNEKRFCVLCVVVSSNIWNSINPKPIENNRSWIKMKEWQKLNVNEIIQMDAIL